MQFLSPWWAFFCHRSIRNSYVSLFNIGSSDYHNICITIQRSVSIWRPSNHKDGNPHTWKDSLSIKTCSWIPISEHIWSTLISLCYQDSCNTLFFPLTGSSSATMLCHSQMPEVHMDYHTTVNSAYSTSSSVTSLGTLRTDMTFIYVGGISRLKGHVHMMVIILREWDGCRQAKFSTCLTH